MLKKLLVGVAVVAVMLVVWEKPWLNAPERVATTAGSEADVIASAPPEVTDSVAPTRDASLRTAVSEPAVGGETLSVHVIARDAVPVVDARVWLWHGDTLESDRTRAEGRAHFTPSDGAGRALVVTRDHPAIVRDVAPLRGTHEIVLPEGATVGGVVRVDGAIPLRPVELQLYDVATPLSELPAELRAQLEAENVNLSVLASRTEPDGSFAFSGLAPDWWGRIGVRRVSPYAILRNRGLACADLWTAVLPGPRDDLVLELTRLPAVISSVFLFRSDLPVFRSSVFRSGAQRRDLSLSARRPHAPPRTTCAPHQHAPHPATVPAPATAN
jgi:hypothetical protein